MSVLAMGRFWAASMGLCVLGACGGGGDSGDGGQKLLVSGASVELGSPLAGAADTSQPKSTPSASQDVPVSGKVDVPTINKPLQRPYSVVNVGIGSVTPSRIDAVLYERSQMSNTLLFGTPAGDIGQLNGRALYLSVNAPYGMFTHAGGGVVNQPAPGVAIVLQGGTLRTAGTYNGALELMACTDPSCATRLRNVPYSVPYAVSVLRGFRLPGSDQDQIAPLEVRLPAAVFGQAPPAGQVSVVPPERAPFDSLTSWVQSEPIGGVWGFDSPRQPRATLAQGNNGQAVVSARVSAMLPAGLYAFTVTLGSTYRVGENSAPGNFLIRFLQEVRPDRALPVLFDPPQLNLTVGATATQGPSQPFEGVSGDAMTSVAYEGVEYLLSPEQQALIPPGPRELLLNVTQPSGWRPLLAFGQNISARNCVSWWSATAGTTTYCLPPGTYAFRLRYRLTEVGSTLPTYGYLPGAIEVVP